MIGSPSSSARPLAILLFVSAAAACGLRSDPFAPDYALTDAVDPTESNDDDSGDPNRAGTCNNPLAMAFAPASFSGELSGPSFAEGWCGRDGGPEDVYSMTPDYDVDIILTLDAANTDFTPTLRVVEDGCADNTGFTKICTDSWDEVPFHFLARAGHTYSVIVDSPDGSEGAYSFRMDPGLPPIDLCPVHPETIVQIPGSSFLWNNDFSQGQGRVDGYCGGPGRENMFALSATYPGNVYARVETTDAFAPVINLRTDCAATSELACNVAQAGGVAELGFFIEQPGQYYLVVDQAQIGSGGYSLRVDFD